MENYQQPEGDEGGAARAGAAAERGAQDETRGPQGRVIRERSGEPGTHHLSEAEEHEPPHPSEHELLSALEVRMHFPEGGVPKEGPSAGIAVATALLSALVQAPVRPKVALTGEITLTGQVLPVGGLKEKLLAALREGVQTVILPKQVGPEVEELPVELKKGLEIAYVENFTDVIPLALLIEREQEGKV
jgi:ATP-dependent Lon protease